MTILCHNSPVKNHNCYDPGGLPAQKSFFPNKFSEIGSQSALAPTKLGLKWSRVKWLQLKVK